MNVNDLTSLLWILKMSRQNGVVLVELLERKGAETRIPWQAHLYLVEGKVVACRIYSMRDGHMLLTNDEAVRWLVRWEQREFAWRALTPQQTRALLFPHQPFRTGLLPPPRGAAPMQPYTFSARDAAFPQRLATPEQSVMGSWPRQHRRVFALVNGKRSVESIAAMLKLPVETVEKILNDLRTIGAIQK